MAERQGLKLIGVIGVLLDAKDKGMVDKALVLDSATLHPGYKVGFFLEIALA